MNRRGFLASLGLTSAALAVPEIWTPKRTFFLPPRGGWATRPGTITITAAGEPPPVDYQWTRLEGGSGLVISETDPARAPWKVLTSMDDLLEFMAAPIP